MHRILPFLNVADCREGAYKCSQAGNHMGQDQWTLLHCPSPPGVVVYRARNPDRDAEHLSCHLQAYFLVQAATPFAIK